MTDEQFKEFIEEYQDRLVDPEHNPRTFKHMWTMYNYYRSDKSNKEDNTEDAE